MQDPRQDRELEQRLAYLRRTGRATVDGAAPTSGADETGSIVLEVDASGWVVDSQVSSLDGLREVDAFVAAIRRAYFVAALSRLAVQARDGEDEPPPSPADEERWRGIAEGRVRLVPPPRPHLPRWELPRERVADAVTVAGVDRAHRPVRGSSRDGEITLSASVATGLGEIEVDPDWLASTGIDIAHYALREAVQDLLGKGAL